MTSKRDPKDDKAFGAKGGKETLKRHGRDHFKEIGREGGLKADHSRAGKAGGEAVKKKYGPDYFREIALKRHRADKEKPS